MPQERNAYVRSLIEVLKQRNTVRQQLPAGVILDDDGVISVKVEELQPGMKPVAIEHPAGVFLVSEDGARFHGAQGDFVAYWRDGLVETKLVNVQKVRIASGVQLAHHQQITLNHGTEYRWNFLPYGSLRLIYDAAGILDEVLMQGLHIHKTENGTLTVIDVC